MMEPVTRVNRRRIAIVLALCAAVAATALIPGPASEAKNPYSSWKYPPLNFNPPVPERWVFDNGLIVHFLHDVQLPVVTLTALVRVGGAHVPAEQTGLASITAEVLATGGTASRTPEQVDQDLEFRGISWEGSSDLESSEFSMRCLAKDFDVALGLFAELLQRPRFDSSKFQLAVDNALEELRRQNDSPGDITRREFARLVYGDHPYGRSPSPKTVGAITRDDVLAFHRRYFHPNATILAISGDLSAGDLKKSLQRAFGNWQQTSVVWPEIPTPTNPPKPGVYVVQKNITQTNIRFGHLGIDRHNPDRHAVRVLNHILGGGGFTARMVEKVRSDSGWAYSVGTAFTTADRPGMFLAYCQTKTETTAKTLGLMQWVIDDLLQNGITEAELKTAKESILNSDVFNYETPSEIVERYARQEYNGFPIDQLKKDVEAIAAVTRADVESAAKKYLDPKHYTILAVGKPEEFDAPLTKFGAITTIELEEVK